MASYLQDGYLSGYLMQAVTSPESDIVVALGGGEGDIVIEAAVHGEMVVVAYVIDNATKAITEATVDLNGSDRANWNGQTNLGKLTADALKWYAENKIDGMILPWKAGRQSVTIRKRRILMKELLSKPIPEIPTEIRDQLDNSKITLTPLEEMNTILCSSTLQLEVGYGQFDNGDWLVSMTCPLPGITPEMVQWWLWWHCQEDLRYQVWYPGDHMRISYHKKDQAYFEQATMPPFQPNSQRPVERIGGMTMPLQIDFVTAESFGFSPQTMKENGIPLICCGHVSAFGGLVKHTEMSHICKMTEDGLFLISRFWLGKTLKNPLLRKVILTEKTARGMAEHCCIEYRNLAEILPQLYQTYCK